MAETAAPDPKPRKSLWSRPIGKVAFWVCGVIAVIAFGAAVLGAGADGWQGFVYLSGLAAVGFLVLYAIAAGETSPALEAWAFELDLDLGDWDRALAKVVVNAEERLPRLVKELCDRGRVAWLVAAARPLPYLPRLFSFPSSELEPSRHLHAILLWVQHLLTAQPAPSELSEPRCRRAPSLASRR